MKSLWGRTGLGILAAVFLASAVAAQEPAAPGRRYLLLLREDAGYESAAGAAARTERIAEYRQWSKTTPGIEAGDKLSDEAWSLAGAAAAKTSVKAKDDYIAGLFIIRAGSDAEAVRVAQTCPHLRYGGRIELRPIE